MAALSAWTVPLLAIATGWLLSRALRVHGGLAVRLWELLTWACGTVAGGLIVLDLVGVVWTATSVLLLLLATAGAAAAWGLSAARGSSRPPGSEVAGWTWAGLAATGAALHGLLLARTPSFGWDFRYIWGLKARVFAAAGAHDLGWLGWHAFSFARTDYPPLWPDLLASGVILGSRAGAVAAAWTALFALGLAAVAWTVTAGAPGPVRALAAGCAAWAPVVFAQNIHVSGSAEAAAAFFTAVVVAGVVLAVRNRGGVAWPTVVAAAVALALTKNEGAVLALAIGVAAAPHLRPRRAVWLLAAPAAVFALWRLVVWSHHIPGLALRFDPASIAARVVALPAALASAADPASGLCLALLVVSLALVEGEAGRSLRWAFALWGAAVLSTYLVAAYDLAWYMETSLARVLATPLPILLAVALHDAWERRHEPIANVS